jgi:hypothetical protein
MVSLLSGSLLSVLALGGAACSTLSVHADHDPRADFTRYHTYAWSPDSGSKPASDISGLPSDLMENRIRATIEAQLATRGLKPAKAGEKPDLFVRDQLVQRQMLEGSGAGYSVGFGYGYGPWYGAIGGPLYPSVRQFTEGTLVIDLIDVDNHRLVWRGLANDELANLDDSPQQVDQIVTETLRRYPPPPTGQG